MTSTSIKKIIPRRVSPENILVSTYKKEGLSFLLPALINYNPRSCFFATGGTGQEITGILGEKTSKHFRSIEKFTTFPELQGGLVKTLHPKIFAGLLADPTNEAHKQFIQQTMNERTGSAGVFFDMVICNFYPFEEVIGKPLSTPEDARNNIDIGGPSMIMAAAKNWHRIAVLTTPEQYAEFVHHLTANNGIDVMFRFQLAQEAMKSVSNYRAAITNYFSQLDFENDVLPSIRIGEE